MTITATPTAAPLPSHIDLASLAPQIAAVTAAVTNLTQVLASITAQTPAATGTVGAAGAEAGAGTVAGGGGTSGMSCACCAGATTTATAGASAVGANAAPAAPLATSAAGVTGGGANAAPAAAAAAPAPAAAAAPVEEAPKEKSKAEKVVDYAKGALGKPYVFGAAGPGSYDCSGLTLKALEEVGVKLPHSASAQMKLGTEVSKDALQPGDLLFFDGGGHSAVYIGDGKLIHAPQPGKSVEEKPFTGWYQQHFTVAKRFI